jgi:endonuclease YncB( thermonuclease family)
VAICAVNGVDLGEWLVRDGLAMDWPNYSGGRYAAASQAEARAARRGFWSGQGVEPWRYRECMGAAADVTACSLKSN